MKADTGTLGAVSVSLDGYAKATVGLTDRQFLESSAADLKIWAGQMGNAVAAKVITDTFAKMTKANYPTTLTPTAGMSVADLLVLAREKMGTLKVPKTNRTYFPSPLRLYGPVLRILPFRLHLRRWLTAARNTSSRRGQFPARWVLTFFESTILPPSAAAPNGFVVHPAAMAVAACAVTPSEPKAYLGNQNDHGPRHRNYPVLSPPLRRGQGQALLDL
ncbi:MAG: hypothetical protein ACLU7D_08990 [Collinsella sp.]